MVRSGGPGPAETQQDHLSLTEKSNQIYIYSQHIQTFHIINIHNIIPGAYGARCQLATSDRLQLTLLHNLIEYC